MAHIIMIDNLYKYSQGHWAHLPLGLMVLP